MKKAIIALDLFALRYTSSLSETNPSSPPQLLGNLLFTRSIKLVWPKIG